MNNAAKINKENSNIAFLLDGFLNVRSATSVLIETHLDDDSLNALIEGKLSKVESQPIVNHLVGCGFCRHMTAELVKLDLAFSEELVSTTSLNSEPTKVSEVISSLFSRLFGNQMGEVFAHQEPDDEDDNKIEDTSKN
jgi:hypothetical protein